MKRPNILTVLTSTRAELNTQIEERTETKTAHFIALYQNKMTYWVYKDWYFALIRI